MDHWRRGHKQICKEIHRGGNAEHYHADKKYKEAVAVAVEKCAADTKGQTCYICTEALHWKTKEGLVRMCSCRGTAGFVHVSCLAEQAKILVAEGEENNMDTKVLSERWNRWQACRLCGQAHHDEVACALGWACWKTNLGRPEGSQLRSLAMMFLAYSLQGAGQDKDALNVFEATLSTELRLRDLSQFDIQVKILNLKSHIAVLKSNLGQKAEALAMQREIYAQESSLLGKGKQGNIQTALILSKQLLDNKCFAEARSLLRETIDISRTSLGPDAETTFRLCAMYSHGIILSCYATRSADARDLLDAEKTLGENAERARRVLGPKHSIVTQMLSDLALLRKLLPKIHAALGISAGEART